MIIMNSDFSEQPLETNQQTEWSTPASISSSRKNNKPINYVFLAAVILVCSIIFGISGYFVGLKSQNSLINSKSTNNQEVAELDDNALNSELILIPELPNQNSDLSEAADSTNTVLPEGWIYKSNGECGVKFAIPPKVEPYFIAGQPNGVTSKVGRFWDFPRGAMSSTLLSLAFGDGKSNLQQEKQAMTSYANTEEASGYVASAVSVSCLPNVEKYVNQDVLEKLQAGLRAYDGGDEFTGMLPDRYQLISSKDANRWNHQVIDLEISEHYSNFGKDPFEKTVKYTIFTTPNFVYEVRAFGEMDDSFVQDTAGEIFERLVFE